MSDEHKRFVLESLRNEFVAFMTKLSQMPGSQLQKQQAFIRFDEGHMWMQNSVATYVAPREETTRSPTNEENLPAIEQSACEPLKNVESETPSA